MTINLIFARAKNGVIGKENTLPWHLPEDLAHFKKTTGSHPVIMGRKTWLSLPEKFRPLPGRKNVVLTRDSEFNAPGAHVIVNKELLLDFCKESPLDAWIIGGAEIYHLMAPYAHNAVVTEIDLDVEGDAFAPELCEADGWTEFAREEHVSAKGIAYRFIYLKNTKVTHG